MKTKIKIKSICIALLIFSIAAAGTASAASVISVVPQSQNANQGGTFSVNVTVDPAGISVNGVQINLKFDPNVVQLNSVDIGDFLGSDPLKFSNIIDNTNGNLALAYTIQAGNPVVTTPGTFATLNFQAKAAGTSTLDLTMAALSGADGIIPGVMADDGTVTVNPPSGGGSMGTPSISIISPATTANQGGTFSVNVTVDPAGISVNGVQMNLKFDPTVVQLNSVVIGNFLGNNPIQFNNNIDNTNGNLVLAYTVAGGNPAVTTSGTYATLNFKVNSNAPAGTSTLDLTMAKLSNASGNIPGVMANDGTVTVNPPSGDSSASSQKFASQTSTPSTTVQKPLNTTTAAKVKTTPVETEITAITTTAAEAASAPKMPGFSAPMALIAVLTALIILVRRK